VSKSLLGKNRLFGLFKKLLSFLNPPYFFLLLLQPNHVKENFVNYELHQTNNQKDKVKAELYLSP